jgi:hypothetical protein
VVDSSDIIIVSHFFFPGKLAIIGNILLILSYNQTVSTIEGSIYLTNFSLYFSAPTTHRSSEESC